MYKGPMKKDKGGVNVGGEVCWLGRVVGEGEGEQL